jgi:hypothetical protein
MRHSILFVATSIFILLISCKSTTSDNNQAKDQTIDIASAFSNPQKLNASEIFKTVRYVRLETNDSCLIGRNAFVQLLEDEIVITTNQKQCYLFDRTSGQFICSVGHIGNDPEGYSSVNCWINESTNQMCFNGWNNQLVCYDDKGQYHSKISVPVKGEETNQIFNYIDENTYILLKHGLFSSMQDSLFIFRNNEILNQIAVTEDDYLQVNIDQISVLNGETGIEQFGPIGRNGVILIDYQEPDMGNIVFMGNKPFWHTGKDLYFKNTYNDTIYQIKDKALTPAFVFDVGKYHWPYKERYNKKHDHSILITEILDSKDYILFRFITRLFDYENRKLYNGIFLKATGAVKIDETYNSITDDINHFLPFQPFTVTNTGEYAGLFTTAEITEWFENNPDKLSSLPAEIQGLIDLDEEDNPVVFILE